MTEGQQSHVGRHRRPFTSPPTDLTIATPDAIPRVDTTFTRIFQGPQGTKIHDLLVEEMQRLERPVPVSQPKRRPKDLLSRLGNGPKERVFQREIKKLLHDMEPHGEVKIVLGQAARHLILQLPSAASLKESVLTIHGVKDGSWYVDLLHKPEVPPPPIPDDVPTTVRLVKTPDKVSSGLIDLMKGYLSQGWSKPPSPREVAAAVGDMMHLVADANWPAIFGHLNYETEFELPSGRRPDVYDPTTGRIAEYGTPNQAMKKIIIAAMYSLEVKRKLKKPDSEATVYLYDPNTEAWKDYASAWRKKK